MEKRLKKLLEEVASERQASLIELEVMLDHVHLLVEVQPQFGVHRLIKGVKGRSSWVPRDKFPWLRSRLPSLSTTVSTVGGIRTYGVIAEIATE